LTNSMILLHEVKISALRFIAVINSAIGLRKRFINIKIVYSFYDMILRSAIKNT
jgi:hypothetical protein